MKSRNPYNENIIKDYPSYNTLEVENIINVANNSQHDWKKVSISNRIIVIKKVKNNLISSRKISANMITQEMGKPIKESLAEIDKCIWLCEYYIENSKKILKAEIIKTDASKSYVSFEPLGVILGIMPWNFPYWQVFRFAIPAILSGNTVIVKHASNVSGCSLLIEKIFSMKIKIFQSLLLTSIKMKDVIENPIIKAISLTGSEEAGSKVASIAGNKIKKVLLELGGSDAFIVCKDADIKKASEKAVAARMLNAGQSCIAAKRFIVHEEIKDEFINNIINILEQMKIDNPVNVNTQIGPLARKDILQDLQNQIKDAIKKGAKILYQKKKKYKKGYFFSPVIIDNIDSSMKVYNNETFGPLFTIFSFKKNEEAVKIANDTQYGLGGSIWSKNTEKAKQIGASINTGAIFINEMTKSDPRLPFGGIGISGYGRELGSYGIKEFVNIKTVYIN